MPPQYKFVEVAPVTDETLETAVNEWVAQGWTFEGIRFVTTEHSKRPQLAFVSFVKPEGAAKPSAAQPAPRPLSGEDSSDPGVPRVITAAHGTDVD